MSIAVVKTKQLPTGQAAIFLRYDHSIRDLFTIVVEAKKGINAKAFFDVVSISGIDRNKLAGLMNVSLKTLLRYKQQNKKLSATKSERVLKLIALYKKGNEIFGDSAVSPPIKAQPFSPHAFTKPLITCSPTAGSSLPVAK